MYFKAIFVGVALALSTGSLAFAGALDAVDSINEQAFHSDPRVTGSIDQGLSVNEGITGPRVTALVDQIQGVDQGITDARQVNKIEPAEAQRLHMRAAHISRVAERTAAVGHGTIPAGQYQQLLHQLDDLSQTLRVDTGSAFLMGNGGDGGYYPNGYGPNG
ncbi:hypothetical protein LHFGNBLO_002830 [Mesorhizobium sp. AR10]|uniref:hypothetical protein n=1 Tax=Mesorhizobium sp. AR10 TaxID=2865839 RepID=UPI00215DE062|nr:hypothetical protein [Mesorhizobium sp. AR10]UVK41251.1 hypothetical protein LHFGNBLO_002830 [Mesorhizobium sp. AR10]